MTSARLIEKQLKDLGFNYRGWGRSEVKELHNIILPDEEIYECVNGIYEGGFAMLLATDVRVLLVDKKPLNYLTVEDLRFDMINEIDYNHRLMGAYISVSAGNKNLKFTSINQARLRKLIGHVQSSMAEAKKKQAGHQEGQNQHLEQINQQLQSYLLAQYQQQQKLYDQLQGTNGQSSAAPQPIEPVRPSPELSDYLYAQSLLAQHQAQTGQPIEPVVGPAAQGVIPASDQLADLYSEGLQEVFGKHGPAESPDGKATVNERPVRPPVRMPPLAQLTYAIHKPFDVNPLSIAYSKLPMALRNRKFGRPSFHAHSQQPPKPTPTTVEV